MWTEAGSVRIVHHLSHSAYAWLMAHPIFGASRRERLPCRSRIFPSSLSVFACLMPPSCSVASGRCTGLVCTQGKQGWCGQAGDNKRQGHQPVGRQLGQFGNVAIWKPDQAVKAEQQAAGNQVQHGGSAVAGLLAGAETREHRLSNSGDSRVNEAAASDQFRKRSSQCLAACALHGPSLQTLLASCNLMARR